MEISEYLASRKEHASGTYSAIVSVTLADKAPAGVTVYVGAYIKNLWSGKEWVNAWGYYDSSELDFGGWGKEAEIAPGAEWPISDTFKMPNHNVVVEIQSWVWWGEPYNAYYLDDVYSQVVKVEAITPPVTCTTDADCPEGHVCVDGVCVLKEEEEVEVGINWWLWGSIAVIVIIVAIAIARGVKVPLIGK